MNRRSFLQGLALGTAAVAGGVPLFRNSAWAKEGALDLSVTDRVIEVNGKAAKVFGLIGPDGRSGLTLDADTPFDVRLVNRSSEGTLVHWHGLTPPWEMDGVPDNPAPLIAPGEARRFTFGLRGAGTHWMHAHTLQEQALLAAPLIVRSKQDRESDRQEVVVLLHDFSFRSAEELLAGLKGATGGMGGHAMHMQGHATPGMAASAMPMDVNDIEYDAYLANDRTLDDPEVVAVDRGGRIRLRIINGATATAFTIDTGALPGMLAAVDGQPVRPLPGRHFPVSMGQRLDILLDLPGGTGAYPVLALREGAPERTGIILATKGAPVERIATTGEEAGPVLDLGMESRLHALDPLSVAAAEPSRIHDLVLAGDMAGYDWQIDGAGSMTARRGEWLRLIMTNRSMMGHPMHLHGHHFQVVAINGVSLAGAVRDTVHVPPMASVEILFKADNPGNWPFHCHHLYHMAAGMMTFVRYEGSI